MTKFIVENELFGTTGVQDVRLRVHTKALQGVRVSPHFVLCVARLMGDFSLDFSFHSLRDQANTPGHRIYCGARPESVAPVGAVHGRRSPQGEPHDHPSQRTS
jgi:hypothetical protein